MKAVVCVKRAPASFEDVELTSEGEIDDEYVEFDLNEWDSYALEEAVELVEENGGEVTVLAIGGEELDETIQVALAKGADRAVRVYDEGLEGSDSYAKSKVLAAGVKYLDPDVVFTGVQSEDEGHAQVGVAMAETLGLPHASIVTGLELNPESGEATVTRELEGGLEEKVELRLPALFTVQTGINEPRYASIMAIRKARDQEIEVLSLDALDLDADEVGEAGALTRVDRLFEPVMEDMAEIIEGTPEEESEKLVEELVQGGAL